MPRYCLEVPNELESLRVAASFTDAVLRELGDVPDKARLLHDLALVSSEALTNALRHGTTGAAVRLAYAFDAEGIEISVTDHGEGFDLDGVALPNFDENPEGGYGIYIARAIMNEVRYERADDGNHLILTKRWAGG